jgi:hypothetical protein
MILHASKSPVPGETSHKTVTIPNWFTKLAKLDLIESIIDNL